MSFFVVKFSGSEGLSAVTGYSVHPLYHSFSAAGSGFGFNNNSHLVSVGDTIVYKYGYYSVNGGAWQRFNLSGTMYGSGSVWLRGSVNYSLPSFGVGEHYVIVYSCSYNNTNRSWDCHGNNWQLIVVNNSVAPVSLASCSDGVQNGIESGVDCGGDCEGCRTFYISPLGSDVAGDGSLSSPWRTLYKACNSANVNGDLIYVAAGTYNETQQCSLAAGVSIRGEGDSSLISTTFSTAYQSAIKLSSSSQGTQGNQSISYIKMDGNNLTSWSAIMVLARSNVQIHDCSFVNFNNAGIYFSGTTSIFSGPPTTYATGNKFYNNMVSNCAAYPSGDGQGNLMFGGQDGIEIYNNILNATGRSTYNNGYNIKFCGNGYNKGFKIHDNIMSRKIDARTYDYYDFSMELWNTRGGAEIYNNKMSGGIDIGGVDGGVFNCLERGDYAWGIKIYNNTIGYDITTILEETVGIYLEGNTDTAIIERNTFKNQYNGIFFSLPESQYTAQNHQINYNIFNNVGYYGIRYTYGSNTGAAVRNITFYNNVVYMGSSGSRLVGIGIPSPGTTSYVNVSNNIIVGTTYDAILACSAQGQTQDHITIQNNIFYQNSANIGGLASATNYVHSGDILSNPLFVNAAAENFHLQASSPAINNGTDVGLTTDFDGNSIVGVPDIGAFEYQGYVVNITGNLTVNTGNLTVNNSVGGTTSGNASGFSVPVNRTITAIANTNYSFVNWSRMSGNCTIASTISSSTTVQITGGSCVVQANFVYNSSNVSSSSTYYISASGSDSTGNGSYSNPWKSLYKACNSVTTAGNTIHVLAGTYNETQQCVLAVGVSIVGEGESSVISSSISTTWTSTIYLHSTAQGTNGNQSISYIKMDGNGGIAFQAIQVDARSNVSIHHCNFSNFLHGGVSMDGKVSSSSVPPTIYAKGNTFHDNMLTNCSEFASGTGYGEFMFGGQDGIEIYNNYMTSIDRTDYKNGYNIKYSYGGYSKGFKIYNNTLIMANKGASDPFYDFSIELWHTQGGAEFYNNTMTGGIDFGGGTTMICLEKGNYSYGAWVHDNVIGPDAMVSSRTCIYLERNTEYAMIESNIFKNCYNGVTITPSAGENVSHHTIRYNIFNNVGFYGIRYQYGTSSAGANVSYLDFYNNVFYVSSGIVGIGIPTVGNASYINITNNIIQGASYAAILAHSNVGQSLDHLTIQNNIFYGNANSNVPRFENLTPTNYVNVNNIIINPLFVNAAAGNFHLQASSPAINNGTDVGLTSDFDGNLIVGLPDIGAYEYK